MYGSRDRLAEFQRNPSFEALDGFAKANSDVAKSMYELLIKATTRLDGTRNSLPYDGNRNESLDSTSELSMMLIEAGQVTHNDVWISLGERLMTAISNFEQKYSDINSITHIVNSVDVDSLPRNEFEFYAIGFAIAG
jgi:hypothetical protein